MKEVASIIGGFIVAAFLAFAVLYVFTIPAKDITLKDIPPGVAVRANPEENAIRETTPVKNIVIDSIIKDQVNYYIIISSVKNPILARQKAEELSKERKTDFIVLPPSPEGNYRISCGKYPTAEEAESTIKSIRANINPDAWIYSLRIKH